MSMEDIIALPIDEISDNDAVMLLWITNTFLPWGFILIRKWGFEYKTCFTWKKNRMGLGYWARGITEHCLLSVRGNVKPPKPIPFTTLIEAPISQHSVKPEIIYHIAETLGEPPRLELFQRQYTDLFPSRDGWEVWGQEAKGALKKSLQIHA